MTFVSMIFDTLICLLRLIGVGGAEFGQAAELFDGEVFARHGIEEEAGSK